MSKNFDPQRASASNQRKIAEALQQQVRRRQDAAFLRQMATDPDSLLPPEKPKKYRNIRTEYVSPLIGPKFYDSKKEADFAATLDQWKAARLISFWLRQIRFPIGGGVVHVVDFMTVGKGEVTFYEVKGRDLAQGKAKRRQTEERYGIKIIVV